MLHMENTREGDAVTGKHTKYKHRNTVAIRLELAVLRWTFASFTFQVLHMLPNFEMLLLIGHSWEKYRFFHLKHLRMLPRKFCSWVSLSSRWFEKILQFSNERIKMKKTVPNLFILKHCEHRNKFGKRSVEKNSHISKFKNFDIKMSYLRSAVGFA